MTVRIPIKPHIKKFVIFTMAATEPIIVKERDMLGMAIIHALQETRQHKFDRLLDSYTEVIEVVLNHDMKSRSPRRDRLLYMNLELERNFLTSLLVWVVAQKSIGIPANEACKKFLATLSIDENEYSYDAAYKTWQRSNLSKKHLNRTP